MSNIDITSLGATDRDEAISATLHRNLAAIGGFCLLIIILLCATALATWSVNDPSLTHATSNPTHNALGFIGASFSDILMQFLGLAGAIALAPAAIWGWLCIIGLPLDPIKKRAAAWFIATLLMAGAMSCLNPPATWPLPLGLGGVIGDLVLKLPTLFSDQYPTGIFAGILFLTLFVPASLLLLYAAGILWRQPRTINKNESATELKNAQQVSRDTASRTAINADELTENDEDDDSFFTTLAGFISHHTLSVKAYINRRRQQAKIKADQMLEAQSQNQAAQAAQVAHAAQTSQASQAQMQVYAQPQEHDLAVPQIDPYAQQYDQANIQPHAQNTIGHESIISAPPAAQNPVVQQSVPVSAPIATSLTPVAPAPEGIASARVQPITPPPAVGKRIMQESQPTLGLGNEFLLPSLHMLNEPKPLEGNAKINETALEQNARLLENVLEDFGVKGKITKVHPGPVVTLYELEPAPGIKSSRVIGLADDIARSMSALAVRVAVIPGKNAIGIELPNSARETVFLRELLASQDFEKSKAKLSLCLGKTIGGDAVIADLAKMPHLLVAGTTGSGKSVAINTMILSLLYKHTPEECKLIMIDPKMLELSIYDGIPHLLTPVVTDPKKAVVALKWTVREMEDRYKKMSKVGVRNIDGFNARVKDAAKKGEVITRTVQTGFNRETGEAIYETEEMDLEPMPYIVVIIDEMADLMMVAGKDIEGTVQRLAQMARAAGIHVIMATQRPSVDVITGTIKANFPTRISFQVTSKIDSRTILGEMGAEQLLGMGDMLYMAGGGRITRVHGPFVDDPEVEKIVNHLKSQGIPQYLEAVTEDEEEEAAGAGATAGGINGDPATDDPYDQAVAIVLRDRKASTSYIQRRLSIGYNRAASLIERMEEEGVIGPANHAGKREILVPAEEEVF